MTRALLFDLDGTLTDSAPGILACIEYALVDMGIPVPPQDELRVFLGPPLMLTFTQGFGMSTEQATYALAKYRERYHDVGLFENSVYDGIPELLDALAARDFTLAVATSKPTYSATRILERFELADSFAFIGGAGLDGSRDTKADVIAHTLVELRAQGLDVSVPEVVMIGDRHHDVDGARAHGIDCVGVLWGYGSVSELTDAGAIALVESPSGLLELAALQGS